ncbi:MAG: hypothetical protein F6J93_30685 [Oscillatoria sp. SIO1A7]|nr:hypothetical protein [Oscillatoria sp. SIO1A7]
MNKEKFPTLAQFCSAYFHQDWDLEAPDSLGIIRNYIKEESNERVQQVIKEIEQLLCLYLETEQIKKILEDELKCYYNPTAYGISHSDWLLWVQISLKQGVSTIVPRSA